MFEKLRALFSTPTGIVSRPSEGGQLTAERVLQSLISPSAGSSLGNLLLEMSNAGPMRYSPLISAVRFVSEAVATLPLLVYRKTGKDGKERATDTLAYSVLKSQPNEYQTAFIFWRAVIHIAIYRGNCFILIERNGLGEPGRLTILDNTHCTVRFSGGQKWIDYKSPSVTGTIAGTDVLHIQGFSNDGGLTGEPLYSYASEAIKIGCATEQYCLRFFSQGHASNGHLECPPGITDAQYTQVSNSWTASHSGEPNMWKTPVLAYGVKFVADATPNDDAQLLELRQFQINEVARLTRVPPHVIYSYASGGTYQNIEAAGIDLVTNCLQPWLTQVEMEVNSKLFTGTDLQAEFLIDARLRGDTQTRYSAHQIGRQGGWLSINDIRRMENMPPIDGGDTYLATPVGGAPNPTPATPAAATPEPAAPADPDDKGTQ